MTMCEDHPCCGHVDGLPCDWTPDYESMWTHIGCEHEAGYCALEDRDDDELLDPSECEHVNAYQTRMKGWCCDDCLADLVMVTDTTPRAYPSKVVPGLMLEITVLGWHFEAVA